MSASGQDTVGEFLSPPGTASRSIAELPFSGSTTGRWEAHKPEHQRNLEFANDIRVRSGQS